MNFMIRIKNYKHVAQEYNNLLTLTNKPLSVCLVTILFVNKVKNNRRNKVSSEMYQQTPDQRLDIVSHVHRSGVTGGQLDQRYQEVLALLHTFQRLLLVKYLVITSHLLSQLLSSTLKTQFVAAFCRVFRERISLIWIPALLTQILF